MDFMKDMQIDENALDVEWLEQPRLMCQYASLAAEAKKQADLAEERLEVIKAEFDKEIRNDPKSFGIDKITEATVENTIAILADVKEANKNYINAKYEAAMARAAVQGMEQRKESLENLVKLHGQQYFAGPSVPRDLSKERQRHAQQQKSDEETADAMRLRRRRNAT